MTDDRKPISFAKLQQEARTPNGLGCPKCGCRHMPAQYTRPRKGYTMRVRVCRNCGYRMTTREVAL